MKFVMTGHKGLIGTVLLEKLKQRGDKPVLLIDSRENNNILDINNTKLTEDVDMMIHLASSCKINKTIENPELAFKNNSHGTFQILEFCRKNNIPKIVFTSSSRILESEKNPYTASKIYGEELCKGYQQAYGINYIIIRPSTVYGGFDDQTKRVTDIFIRNALQNKPLEIYGHQSKTLDFTYVDDFVSGFILAIEEDNKEYDIGSGKATRLDYVAKLIKEQLGSESEIIYKEQETAQPQHVEVNITEMEKLGYSPKTTIEEGMKRTIEWYKDNIKI
tara:strand:- start:621 stop:1448 length:828 start_codon:yes stop_codon:yes gene_type:complete